MEEEKFEISPEEFVLMACGPDLDYKERIDACLARNPGLANATSEGASALMYAANHDCIEIIGSLLKNGADVNYMVNGIWTSLHCAIVQKKEAAASVLITAGANVNIADHAGQTPLHPACSRNLLSTAKLLIKYGAIPSISDNDNLLPLDLWDDSDLEEKLAVIAAIEATGQQHSRPATATGGNEEACTVNEVLTRLTHGHSGPAPGHEYDYSQSLSQGLGQSLGQGEGLDDPGQSEDSVVDDESRAGLGDHVSVGATPEVTSNYNCLTLPITGVMNMASKLCGGGNQNDDEETSATFLFGFGFWAKPMPPRGSSRNVGQNTRPAAAMAPAASPIHPDAAAPAATPTAGAPAAAPAASHSVADTLRPVSQTAPGVGVAPGVNTAAERSPNFKQQAEDIGEAGGATGVSKSGLNPHLVTPSAPVGNSPAVAVTPGPQIHTSRPPPTVAGVVTGTGGGTGSDLPHTTQRSRDLSQHSSHHNSQLNNLSLSSRKDAPLIEGFTTPLRSDGISSAPYLTVTRSTVTRSQGQSMSMSQRHGQQTPPVRLVETIIHEPYKLDISGDEEDDKDKTKQDNTIGGGGSGGNTISNSPSGVLLQQGAVAHAITSTAPPTAVSCQTSPAHTIKEGAVRTAHSQVTPVASKLGSYSSGDISASEPAATHQHEPAAAATAAADGLEAYAAAAAAAAAAAQAAQAAQQPAVAAAIASSKLQLQQQLQGSAQDGANTSTSPISVSASAAHVSPPPPSSEVAGDAPDLEPRSSAVTKPGSPSQLTSAAAAVP